MEHAGQRTACNGCPYVRCRGEAVVRRDGISERTRALEAAARDTEPLLCLYCEHPESVEVARDMGLEVRRDFIVDDVDGVDHVRGSADSVRVAEYPGAVSLDEVAPVLRPLWCRSVEPR